MRRLKLDVLSYAFLVAWHLGGQRLTRPYVRWAGPLVDRLHAQGVSGS